MRKNRETKGRVKGNEAAPDERLPPMRMKKVLKNWPPPIRLWKRAQWKE